MRSVPSESKGFILAAYGTAWVRETSLGDSAIVAEDMRRADAQEVAALGHTPHQAVSIALSMSEKAYTFGRLGRIAGIFGVCPVESMPLVGSVWLLGTGELPRLSYTFLRESRGWLSLLGKGYESLQCCADARNKLHLRWLHWLGFEQQGIYNLGKAGEPFVYMTIPTLLVDQLKTHSSV